MKLTPAFHGRTGSADPATGTRAAGSGDPALRVPPESLAGDGQRKHLLWRFVLLTAIVATTAGADQRPQPAPAWERGEELFRDDFATLARWQAEQMPGGTVAARDGALVIEDVGGCTVWFRSELRGPVIITYEATVVDRGGPRDRVSDLNCFWMATDPAAPGGDVLATTAKRTGRFADYDPLRLYYVGCGGNTNSTTRFRRYDGSGARPLLPEHDRQEPAVLLEGNKPYRITLVAAEGRVQYRRDGVKIFDWVDPSPLTRGRFGFRTVKSHLVLRNFRVWRAVPAVKAMP